MNPLEQLKDLHTPPAPGWWPLAPGWWLLATLVLILLLGALWCLWHRHRQRAYRRIALAEIRQLAAGDTLQLNQLLDVSRRVIVTINHQSPLAVLPGPELAIWLDDRWSGALSRALELDTHNRQRSIEPWLYREEPLSPSQRAALVDALQHWLKQHRRRDLC